MTRNEALSLLRGDASGIEEWNARRARNEEIPSLAKAQLLGANLTGANLQNLDFQNACLWGAILENADLTEACFFAAQLVNTTLLSADLTRADLRHSDLAGANLTQANLTETLLCHAYLDHTNLSHAILTCTNFESAHVSEATFSGVLLSHTRLGNVDLTSFCLADGIAYSFPCHIDWRSAAKSLRMPELDAFLMQAGMPEVVVLYLLDALRSLDPRELFRLMQTTMISYGRDDEKFAARISDVLHRNGVRTWFFPHDARPGNRLQLQLWEAINSYDRVLLICSHSSLQRDGLIREIEVTLNRELTSGLTDILLPIRLDDSVLKNTWAGNRPDIAEAVRGRVIADFRGCEANNASFQQAVAKLLGVLKAPLVDRGRSSARPFS